MGSSKERLKWTQELHDLFEKSVNQLGGPERVTPKSVLKVMGIPGLTIYHVKSHLQKYRMSKFVPESSNKGKFERKSISEILPNFSATSAAQLQEALILQMKVQMRLSDQLEVQRNLKVKIEAQGRFLERIVEESKNRPIIANSIKLLSPVSLPPLLEDSDSIVTKEFESEFYVKTGYKEDHLQASKRLKLDDDIYIRRFKSESHVQGASISLPSAVDDSPWSFGFCQSPPLISSYGTYS